MRILTLALSALLFTACGSKSSSAPAAETPATSPDPAAPAARPSVSAADCEAQGGEVVGDIGDGAIHRPDYVCPAGEPPIGSISSEPGAAVAVEGSVCCKKKQ
jgi:hypothetical protein